MNRKEFLAACGYGCLSVTGLAAILQGCSPVKYLYAEAKNHIVQIPHSEFGETGKYIIVKVPEQLYPIAVFKLSNSKYTALILQCTHQGTQLNVNGDIITCPAHGSEFKTSGDVLHGPAEEPLQSFPVTSDSNNLYIHLV